MLELLARIEHGDIDAIAFTSTPQVRRLIAVGGEARVTQALQRTHVAAIGPVVAEALGRTWHQRAVDAGRTIFFSSP